MIVQILRILGSTLFLENMVQFGVSTFTEDLEYVDHTVKLSLLTTIIIIIIIIITIIIIIINVFLTHD